MLTEFLTEDIDELSDSLAETEQRYCQLEPGDFSGELRRLDLPGVHVTEERIGRSILVTGGVPSDHLVVFVPLNLRSEYLVQGRSCCPSDLMLFRSDFSGNLRLPSSTHCLTVELQLQQLHEIADALHLSTPSIESSLLDANESVGDLSNVLQSAIEGFAGDTSTNLSESEWAELIIERYLKATQPASFESIERTTITQRRKAALEVAEFVMASLDRSCSVTDMCRLVGISERSLRTGFLEVFGIGPNVFQKVQRLSAARLALKAADVRSTTVCQIALDYGFTQLAHFATDYRKHFGERPSATLRGEL